METVGLTKMDCPLKHRGKLRIRYAYEKQMLEAVLKLWYPKGKVKQKRGIICQINLM